jgi:nicotinate-nucleotide pyrophosphorylase
VRLSRELLDALDDLLSRAFAEDGEDITSLAVFGPSARVSARMVCREEAVVCGLAFLPRLFAFPHPPASCVLRAADGDLVQPGAVLAEIEGPAIAVLSAERIALNLVQRMSGIATMTRAYVKAVSGTHAEILDTRKTVPGLRPFDRYAVRMGGGTNHRFGLAHAFLVKDNHADGAGSVWDRASDRADRGPPAPPQTEARTLDECTGPRGGRGTHPPDRQAMAKAVEDVALFRATATGDPSLRRHDPEGRESALAGGLWWALTHSVRRGHRARWGDTGPGELAALAAARKPAKKKVLVKAKAKAKAKAKPPATKKPAKKR